MFSTQLLTLNYLLPDKFGCPPVCWIMYEYNGEKFHINHLWELKG